jgi:spermidine synthase
MEISSVWFAGATTLYSENFYRLAASRLKAGGVFQQWIQFHHIGTTELQAAIVTVRRAFPYVSVWVVGGQGVLVGSFTPQAVQPVSLAALRERGDRLGWRAAERETRLRRLLTARLLAPPDVDALARACPWPVNTDRNRWLEYTTPRYNYVRRDLRHENVIALSAWASFPPPVFAAGPTPSLAMAGHGITPADYRAYFGL